MQSGGGWTAEATHVAPDHALEAGLEQAPHAAAGWMSGKPQTVSWAYADAR